MLRSAVPCEGSVSLFGANKALVLPCVSSDVALQSMATNCILNQFILKRLLRKVILRLLSCKIERGTPQIWEDVISLRTGPGRACGSGDKAATCSMRTRGCRTAVLPCSSGGGTQPPQAAGGEGKGNRSEISTKKCPGELELSTRSLARFPAVAPERALISSVL